jgi:alkylhydroperoxidase family enzyme
MVLEFADAMTRTPVEVSNALFARLREKFSETELVELTSAIAWENYRARFDHALGIEGENFTEGAVCALPVRATEVMPSH